MTVPIQKMHKLIFPVSIVIYGVFTICLVLLLFFYKPYQPAECMFKISGVQNTPGGTTAVLTTSCDVNANAFNSSFNLSLQSASHYTVTANVKILEKMEKRNGYYTYRVAIDKEGLQNEKDLFAKGDTWSGKTLLISKTNKNLFQYLFH